MPALEPVDDRLQQAMQRVLLATLPGMLALLWWSGWGVLVNLLLAGSVFLLAPLPLADKSSACAAVSARVVSDPMLRLCCAVTPKSEPSARTSSV